MQPTNLRGAGISEERGFLFRICVLMEQRLSQNVSRYSWIRESFIPAMKPLIFIIAIKKILRYLLKWGLKYFEPLLTGQEFIRQGWKAFQMRKVLHFMKMYLKNVKSMELNRWLL